MNYTHSTAIDMNVNSRSAATMLTLNQHITSQMNNTDTVTVTNTVHCYSTVEQLQIKQVAVSRPFGQKQVAVYNNQL